MRNSLYNNFFLLFEFTVKLSRLPNIRESNFELPSSEKDEYTYHNITPDCLLSVIRYVYFVICDCINGQLGRLPNLAGNSNKKNLEWKCSSFMTLFLNFETIEFCSMIWF